MGQTLAILRSEGKVPSVSDLLTISLIGVQNRWENSLRRLVGILLGPEDFPEPKFFYDISYFCVIARVKSKSVCNGVFEKILELSFRLRNLFVYRDQYLSKMS